MKTKLFALLVTAFLAVFSCSVFAANLAPQGPFRAFDDNGDPCASCKLYTYEAGTSTPKTTYTTQTAATPNANPTILDSDGYAHVWMGDGSYKFILKDASDATIWTLDNLSGSEIGGFGDEVVALSSSTSITTAYENNLIVATSSPTFSLLSAASAGEGWAFAVRNDGTGTVTIDPNLSETINGAATLTIGAKSSAFIVTNGTAWYTIFTAQGSIANLTVVGNVSGSTALPSTVTILDDDTMATASATTLATSESTKAYVDTTTTAISRVVTRQYLTSGSSATYTRPAGVDAILVRMVGGGGGGGAVATNAGSAGGDTSFNSIVAKGGSGGAISVAGGGVGGAGGTAGTGSATFRQDGQAGGAGSQISHPTGVGGNSRLGPGAQAKVGNGTGNAAAANTGGGGSGGNNGNNCGSGGGSGEYVEIYISSPSSTYTYTVGGGGNGGSAGTQAGGNGGSGLIIVEEYY